MKENDNLEQFFRKSFEDFSAEPSNEMWARIEPVIPPKPTVWGTWVGVAKWLGGLMIVGGLSFGVYHFLESQKQIQVLSEVVDQQAEMIENLEAKMGKQEEKGEKRKGENLQNNHSSLSQNEEHKGLRNSVNTTLNSDSPFNIQNQQIFTQNTHNHTNTTINKVSHSNTIPAINQENTKIITEENQDIETPTEQKNSLVQHSNLFQLSTLSIPLFENQSTSNPSEAKVKKTLNPFPRFSFEGKGGVFTHNLGKILNRDSSKTKNPFSSWQAGFLINFEVNPKWLFQTGFLFKNFKTSSTQIRYNAFPIWAQYRFTFNEFILNAKSGFVMNTLIDTKSGTERVVIADLKSNFIDLTAGLGMDFKLNSNTKLSVEPWVSYSLKPAAKTEKVFQFGINLGARYSIR